MKTGKNRTSNKGRNTSRPPRVSERNNSNEGVYSNNYFMHAATSHIGTVVKVETAQGAVYEGVFKTFSQNFDVVLELAHKIDPNDPTKLAATEVVENFIFHAKDIVYMCASNVEPEFAFNSNTFQTDTCISKCNGEISGEKDLQPWEDPTCNGEEYDLETGETNRNGWDVNEMFMTNEKFGVQTSYDDTLSDYTCQINRKDTKDFKEEEAKAARIAMEIERNPSSQARCAMENGENEEELFAAVVRPGNENESKYVPPPKRNNQHHRVGGGSSRGGNYSSNGNQRSYNAAESTGRPPKNSSAPSARYHQQQQQYHQASYVAHGPAMRDGSSRSSPENKNQMQSTAQQQPQNIAYSSNVHQQQQRSYQNLVPVTNHSANVAMQQQQQQHHHHQSKSQRTSPVSVNTLPNGNVEYQQQTKSMPAGVTQSPSHQYQQNQQTQQQPPQNSGNANMSAQQRKHHQSHHHAAPRVREDKINELKSFGSDFRLNQDNKTTEGEAPKQIQVVTNRNKSPPIPQASAAVPERNVVTVTIVSTIGQNKYTNSTSATQPAGGMGPGPQSGVTQVSAVPQPAVATAVVAQVGVKQSQHLVMAQPSQYQQPIHMQHGDQQVLLHQQHMQPAVVAAHHHPQAMPPPQQPMIHAKSQKTLHQVPIHQTAVLPPIAMTQTPVQIQQHPATATQPPKAVINNAGQSVATTVTVVAQPSTTASVPGPTAAAVPQLPSTVHSRSSLQHQMPLKGQSGGQTEASAPSHSAEGICETDSGNASKVTDGAGDELAQRVTKSQLNPDAKEYVPAVKSFNPVSRSPSTPTQSRPHTPQTPSGYSIHAANAPVATGLPMVLPAYVVTAPPNFVQQPQANRMRKAQVNSHRTPEFHSSNIPVSAVTGQPLLAPSVPLAQSHIGHGTSFSVPAYAHPQLTAAGPHYSQLQMVRMVQQGGIVPIVPSTISYHDTSGSNATAVYMNQGGGAVAMAHQPHVHHPQQHPPPSTAPSPSQTPQGPSQSHTPNSYQHPPMAAQSASPYPPIMCPVIQAPPTHGPPHMVATPAQQHAMQQYLSQHPSITSQPHILSILPHSCS